MEGTDSKEKRLAFPKFTSFKPRPTTQGPAASASASDPNTKQSPNQTPHDRARRHHHKHRQDEYDRSKRGRSQDKQKDASHQRPTAKDESRALQERAVREEVTSDLFVVDRKGDVHNLTYGSIHRYNIPLYQRTGYGNVLGLGNNVKIDRDTSDGSKVRLVATQADIRRRDKHALGRVRRQDSRLLRIRSRPDISASKADTELDQDYIEFSSHRSRKRRRLEHGDQTHDPSTSDEEESADHYRSIEGRAKIGSRLDPDVEAYSAHSDADSQEMVTLKSREEDRLRLVRLSRRTEESPQDIQAWVDLINHQDYVLGLGSSAERREATNAEKRGLADVKLSIYEKALSKVGRRPDRDRLLLGLMDEAAKLWDTKKLASKWREMLQENANLIGLWVRYIDFQQTNFITFTYENCRSIFSDCFNLIGSNPVTSERTGIQAYLFLRMTVFMREAGFSEHATALWQALLEFNFFRPSDTGNSLIEVLSSFSGFWDSEVARVGDKKATGWNNVPGAEVDPQTDGPIGDMSETQLFDSWASLERERTLSSLLPARTLDEVTEDDPYRVILFADVKDFLFEASDQPGQDLLLNAFVLFCQLAPLPGDDAALHREHESWWRDPVLRNELFYQDEAPLGSWTPSGLGVETNLLLPLVGSGEAYDGVERGRHPIGFPLPNFQTDTMSLFHSDGSHFSSWGVVHHGKTNYVDHGWVLRAMQQLVNACPANDRLAEYVLALKFQMQPLEARKYAKTLLKKRQSCLLLYNAYALIESRNGDFPAAERVWSMALAMVKTLPQDQQTIAILLWHTWIWDTLRQRREDRALRLLLAYADENVDAGVLSSVKLESLSPSPAELLKAQRVLASGQQQMISRQRIHQAVALTDCLALLTYLTKHLDPEPALDIYQKSITATSTAGLPGSVPTELIHQARARFLHHHISTTHFYKPALIRDTLAESIPLYPSNTIFLTLYAQNESRFRIDDRVRSITRSLTSGADRQESLITHAFSIFTELHRGVAAGSTIHSARAAFEKAAESAIGKCSATLWKLFLLFETKVGSTARVKDVFYRGMRACPWAKEYYMLAFTNLATVMSFEELQKIYRVMVEKELRIHVDLEEAFEDREKQLAVKAGDIGKGRMAITLPDDESSGSD